MTRSLRTITIIGLVLVALVVGIGIGGSVERQRVQMEREKMADILTGSGDVVTTNPEEEVDLSLLWEVWRTLMAHYIAPEELTTREMVFGAIHGLVAGVGDPYTVFMTPQENGEFFAALQGDLEGIGAELTVRDGSIVVVAPLKGSPAQSAGLFPEDIITKVDGTDVSNATLNEAVTMIRGEKGTDVTLEVYRPSDNDILEITITRDRVHVPSIQSTIIERDNGKVGHIEMNRFDDSLLSEVRNAVKEYQREGVDGVILDVRFNGGGLLDAAGDVVSLFMKEGKVVTVERRNVADETQYVNGQALMPEVPLVVLVNEGSASASEILAGALQDNKRATVIGKQSFGKGTVQEIIDLPGGSSLRVTIARWLTPSGLNLSKTGITPDIEVDRTSEQFANGEDPQLEKAIDVLIGEDEESDDLES